MHFFERLILFLVINFGGLAIGGWLMNDGPQTQWYSQLNKAPWTPPGWVFGVAWTMIMLCFSIYLAKLFENFNSKHVLAIFGFQVVLNILWNYIFFNRHLIGLGLINIILLTMVVFYFFFSFQEGSIRSYRWLLLPYMLWLLIATSLNGYIYLNNS